MIYTLEIIYLIISGYLLLGSRSKTIVCLMLIALVLLIVTYGKSELLYATAIILSVVIINRSQKIGEALVEKILLEESGNYQFKPNKASFQLCTISLLLFCFSLFTVSPIAQGWIALSIAFFVFAQAYDWSISIVLKNYLIRTMLLMDISFAILYLLLGILLISNASNYMEGVWHIIIIFSGIFAILLSTIKHGKL